MKDSLVKNIIYNFSRLEEKMKDNKKNNSPKRIKLFNKKFYGLTPFPFFLCLILMLPIIAQAASVTMTWDRNQEPDIAGYRIYYGIQSGQYNNSITVYDSATQPLQLSYTVPNLSEGTTYYFALKTFDQAGQESDYSVETSQNIPSDGYDSWWDNWYGSQDYLEIGQVDINHVWKTVELTRKFQNPVVIVGPPTRNGRDPCVVRVRNVTSNSFEVRIQEWLYLDQLHLVENVSYMVVEAGEYMMPDGTIWQAGTYSLSLDGTLEWKRITFPEWFLDKPLVFQTGQTFNGQDTVAIRMKNVTLEGFTAELQEEERKKDGHVLETIGYLAMTPNNTDLGVYEISCDHQFTAIVDKLAIQLAVEEEQSLNTETQHVKEKVGAFLIKDYVFAQIQTFLGGDTAALRRK
jgi:hypothetical protein